jgi:lipoic acid synthetase
MDFKRQVETGIKLRGADKVSRIPIKVIPTQDLPTKPEWIIAKITYF